MSVLAAALGAVLGRAAGKRARERRADTPLTPRAPVGTGPVGRELPPRSRHPAAPSGPEAAVAAHTEWPAGPVGSCAPSGTTGRAAAATPVALLPLADPSRSPFPRFGPELVQPGAPTLPADQWPALPDDAETWTPAPSAFPVGRLDRLDAEQRGR